MRFLFYFDYALSIPTGEQTLADLIKTGLANLFNAMNSDELSQVMVLLSDLEAAYEKVESMCLMSLLMR